MTTVLFSAKLLFGELGTPIPGTPSHLLPGLQEAPQTRHLLPEGLQGGGAVVHVHHGGVDDAAGPGGVAQSGQTLAVAATGGRQGWERVSRSINKKLAFGITGYEESAPEKETEAIWKSFWCLNSPISFILSFFIEKFNYSRQWKVLLP